MVHRIGSGARENCASCSDFIRLRRSREKKTTVQWLSGEFNFRLCSYLCFETKSYFNFHSNRKFRASQLSRQPHKKKLLKKRRFDPHKVRFKPLLSLESLILSRIAIWKFDSLKPKESLPQEFVESPVIIQRLHNIQHNGLRVRTWESFWSRSHSAATLTTSGDTGRGWAWRSEASQLQGSSLISQVFNQYYSSVHFVQGTDFDVSWNRNWSNCDNIEFRPGSGTRRNSHRGVDLCLVKTAPRMNRWVVKHYWWWKHWHSHTNLDNNDRTPSPPPIRSYQRDLIQYLVEAQANSLTDQSHQVEYYQETVEMKNIKYCPLFSMSRSKLQMRWSFSGASIEDRCTDDARGEKDLWFEIYTFLNSHQKNIWNLNFQGWKVPEGGANKSKLVR